MTTNYVVTVRTPRSVRVAVFSDLDSAKAAAVREVGPEAEVYNQGMMCETADATAYLTLVNDTNFSEIY